MAVWFRSIFQRIIKAKRWKLVLGAMSLLFVVLLGLAFLSGPLFPWSPLKIGYDHEDFGFATAYFSSGTTCPIGCKDIDEIMEDVERFHGWKFLHGVKIIFCDSWGLFHRGRLSSLGFSRDGPLATTIATGTVIYFSPGLKGSGRNLLNLLRHEFSHAVRYQHMTLRDVLGPYRELHWLDEGVAVHYGNASDYPDAREFRKLAVEKGYLFRITDKGDADKIPLEIRHMFRYAEYNFFFAYLLHKFGRDEVMAYVKETMKEPARSEDLFIARFDVPLVDVVKNFEKAVLDGTWPIIETSMD